MKSRMKFLSAALVAVSAALAGSPAQAADCSTLTNPIYVAGSSAIDPFIKQMGGPLAAQAAPITLVYQKAGGCTGVANIALDTTPTGACVAGACITGNATFYDATGAAQTCTLPAGGQHVDVGISDTFPTSCTGFSTIPADVKAFPGPIQSFLFVVPKASTQTAITFKEAYFVFGFGGAAGMVTPWLNVALQFIRNTGSGTQTITANAVGVPPPKMKGIDSGGSGGVVTMVSGSTSADATIGILSSDVYDIHRDTLKVLAFKTLGQWFAYLPDSSLTSFDKRNVRDGHYAIWSHVELMAHVDGSGNPTTAAAKTFIDLVQGNPTTPAAPFDIIDVEIASHTVPECAMAVDRTTESGPFTPFTPAAPCGCYFESKVGTTSCTACTGTDNTPCGGGKCRRGFCEKN